MRFVSLPFANARSLDESAANQSRLYTDGKAMSEYKARLVNFRQKAGIISVILECQNFGPLDLWALKGDKNGQFWAVFYLKSPI